ncbi:MAG: DUF4625 domain-containing protein [Rikenellaceae bacterium]
MKKQIFLAAAIFTSFTFVSCTESGDTTKPVITLESPAEGEVLAADGEGIHFEMELEDNEGLASYKVEIHSNFDGHSHSVSSKTDSDATETVDFSFNQTWTDIAGQKNATIHHHEIVIPTDATHGDYHFIVYCLDEAGNESYVVRSIEIGDESSEEHDH